MTTQTEVLKIALEALENLINQHYAETTTNDDLEKADNAITAIKEALAQPERHELQAEGKHPPTPWTEKQIKEHAQQQRAQTEDAPL